MNRDRRAVIGSTAAIVLAIGFIAFYSMRSGRRGRDVAVDQIAGHELATELSRRIGSGAGRVVVVTIRDLDDESEPTRAAWKGFAREMKRSAPAVSLETVQFLELLRETAGDRATAMMFGEDGIPVFLFERLMAANPDAAAVISLSGLPAAYGQALRLSRKIKRDILCPLL